MNNTISLSKNELEIMELLWTEERPLTRTEIIEKTPNRSWSKSSIHILLNSLLDKGAIHVDGFVKTNKNYGRTFSAVITRSSYMLSTIRQSAQASHVSTLSPISSVFAALLSDKDITPDVLNELEALIKAKKKDLKNEH